MKTIEQMYTKENSFNILRLYFAVLVLIFHSAPLLSDGRNFAQSFVFFTMVFIGVCVIDSVLFHREQFFKALGKIRFWHMIIVALCILLYNLQNGLFIQYFFIANKMQSVGDIAVFSFFIISGFLIMQSMENSKSIAHYLYKRVLRIFPALGVALFLTSFGIAILVSGSFDFSNITYFFRNITLDLFGGQSNINNVFISNPNSDAINGSLHTLKFEFFGYLLLLPFFKLKNNARAIILLVVATACGVGIYLFFERGVNLFPEHFIWIFQQKYYLNFAYYTYYFVAGVIIYLFRDKIVMSPLLFFLCIAMLLTSIYFRCFKYALLFTLPYVVMFLSLHFKIRSITRYGDYSYGVYIYAYIVQQAIVHYNRGLSLYAYITVSLFAVFLLAIPSWHFVERIALRRKVKQEEITTRESILQNDAVRG